MPPPPGPRQLHECACSCHALPLSPPPTSLYSLKYYLVGIALTFPSRVTLPLKHSLSPFPGGRKSSIMGVQMSITSRPTFYLGFFLWSQVRICELLFEISSLALAEGYFHCIEIN